MKKVALYIRVSTTEQATEGYSIAAQGDRLKSYCRLRNWTIQDTYLDAGYTGTNIERPGLQRLLQNLSNIDTVLVYKLDRLSRSQRDILYLVEEIFLAKNIGFVSIMESFDTSTPFGKAMIGILAVFAQLERETIVERTKLGKERRAKEGYWNGGPPPIGYDLVDGMLIINEFEGMQVKKVFNLYKKYGQNKTAEILNSMGFKTKYGRWQGRSIARIVANPIYIGMIHYKKDIYQGVHEPIITKKDFLEIQGIIDNRSKTKISKSKYLLGGLLWCGHCGARLKASFSTAGKGKSKFYYYVCYSVSKRPLHMVKDPKCLGRYWKMSNLENLVLKEIANIKLDKDRFIKEYHRHYNDNYKNNFDEINTLKNRETDLDTQINRLIDLYQFDKISRQTITNRIENLYQEKKSIEENINNCKLSIDDNIEKVPLEVLLKIFDDFQLVWQEATKDERKDILNMLIKKITVTDLVNIEWNL